MQHCEEPALCAAFDRRGPGVGAGRGLMPGEVKDVHHALPYRLTVERLVDGYGLDERRRPAVHALDGFLELVRLVITSALEGHTARTDRVAF